MYVCNVRMYVMYVCMYVRMYVCTYVCMFVRTYVCVFIYLFYKYIITILLLRNQE